VPIPAADATVLWNLLAAGLGGLAVGIERQWSGHAQGPHARFAGVRTFTMIGLGSGLAGWFWTFGLQGPALALLSGFVALTVVGYVRASGDDIDGTTEVAALVVIAACTLAGLGLPRFGSGIIAITTLLLVEKNRLHGWVQALDTEDIRAGARFTVMALVILPLLPAGPFGPFDAIRPRLLWALVLFFSGLSFVGVLARRIVGPGRGYVLAGLVGGMLSSTSVTLTYSRLSRSRPEAMRALASGTLAANGVLLPRILIATLLLAPPLARSLWPVFVAPFAIAVGLALRAWRHTDTPEGLTVENNPLQLRAAIEMALVFQVVLFAVAFATKWFGQAGLYGSAAVLGLADMDALTLSMADLVTKGTVVQAAANAVIIGVIANTLVKMTIALVIGRGRFRVLTAVGLALVGASLGAAFVW
jgi:uncharacterized membrane protein (DUF4010 family)